MAEKIVYDIQFNGADKAREALIEITKAQKEQKLVINATKKELSEYQKELNALQKEQEAGKELTQEEINRSNELADIIVDLSTNLELQKDVLKDTNSVRRESIKDIDTHNTAINASLGSNEQLRAGLKLLTKEYDQLSEEERENTEIGQKLTTNIKNITDKLKENESAVGDNRRNVGNYEEAITSALGKVNLFGVNLGQAKTQLVSSAKGLKTATGAANIFKVALVAIPIFAVVAAFALLAKAFTGTQRGADALSRVITPIKFVMAGLLGVIQDVSFFLVDKLKKGFDDIKNTSPSEIFKNIGNAIKDNVLNRLKSFSVAGAAIVKILKGDLKGGFKDLTDAAIQFGTGIEDGTDKVKKGLDDAGNAYDIVAEKVKKSTEEGRRYADAVIASELAQIRLTTAIAATNRDLKEQRLIASDQTKTDQERVKALEKAIELSNVRAAQQKELVQNELDLAVLKTKQNDTDRTSLLEIAELKAKLIDIDANALSEQKMISSQLSGIQQKQIKAEEKRIETIQQLIEKEDEKLQKDLQNQLQNLDLLKNETELTDEELQARETLYNNYNDSLSAIRLKTITEELTDAEKLNTELEKKYYEDLLNAKGNEEAKKQITAKYNADKIEDLRNTIQAQIQIVNSELEPLLASTDNSIADSILNEADKQALKARLEELQTELAKTNYEYSQLGVDPITGEKKTLGEMLGIDEETMQDVVGTFQSIMNAITSVMTDANALMQARTEERVKAIDQSLQAGTIDEKQAEEKKQKVRKEAFKKQKALNIAMATVQFAQGSVAAIAGAMTLGNPIVGAIVGAVAVAALAASYGINVAKIKEQTFAEGGYVSGPGSGTSDSIPARLSNGEFVQTKKATDFYGKDFMQSVNSMQLPKLNFAQGGLVAPSPINNVSSQVSKGVQPIAEAVMQSKSEIINVESKFSKLQNQVSNVEAGATY